MMHDHAQVLIDKELARVLVPTPLIIITVAAENWVQYMTW